MEIKEKAFAKINISLDVVSKMENGWHEMRMVMQSVSFHDDIKILVVPGDGKVKVYTDREYIPDDERNIAYRAARIFLDECNIQGFDVNIDIHKRIPARAGLGGGSSDGAAVLRGLNRAFNSKLSRETLEKMGEKLGSDVPFCVAGGTVLATGTGTTLKRLKPMPDCWVLICKPKFSSSTPELFSLIDCGKIKCRPDTQGILTAIEEENIRDVGQRLFNVFEDVLKCGRDTINKIKNVMYDNKAIGACMTGTGSAVYGLFTDKSQAEKAYAALKQDYKSCYLCGMKKEIKI